MKNFLLFLFLSVGLVSQVQAQQNTKLQKPVYGKSFSVNKAIPATDIKKVLGSQDSVAIQLIGQVQNVCQAKGCWMDIKLADNSVMKVQFKNYAFFVPKDIAGKTVILNGMAYNKTISVADQQHYAQDAGLSSDKIKAIKQPKQSVTFTASGVQLK